MNNQKQKMELLGNAPIPKALLAMGIPTMIGMLINALYNLVDAYFVSGLGESPMGAISIVYPLGQVVVGLGLLFGNGAGLIASSWQSICKAADEAAEASAKYAETKVTDTQGIGSSKKIMLFL